MRHLLAIKIDDDETPSYELLIFDWKSGTLINRISPASGHGIGDFAFLDKDRLVLISGLTNERTTELEAVNLMIYDIYPRLPLSLRHRDSPVGPIFELKHLARSHPTITFGFPEIDKQYRFRSLLQLRTGPVPGYATYSKSVGFAYPRVPTLYLPLTLEDLSGELIDHVKFKIFVDVDRLLRFSENGPFTVPWSTWGAYATRWFLGDDRVDSWSRSISGSRYVRIGAGGSLQFPCDQSVFDFNPRTVRHRDTDHLGTVEFRHKLKDLASHGKRLTTRVLTGSEELRGLVEIIGSDLPTVITRGFKAPVISTLPYRAVTKGQVCWAEGWTIDGEHIVGINSMDPELVDTDGDLEDTPNNIAIYKLRV
ncbi:unnamed protein product [Rhizoctonia solani]|uniref:Uncharacterized protein n=1 Tax=Rhizoctonia solani TaxID=456999 RepID=A0A8H2XS77_9AGAM|nr:unnamed protein product [Rhizoctonia solani]